MSREIIQEELLDIEMTCDTRIGGPEKTVEIDESCYGKIYT